MSRDILFMSRILAAVTHEMQNVMAIIKESGALVDDIFKMNGQPDMKHGEKLDAAFNNIQEQVQRGRDLMLMLNGFAHAAPDHPQSCEIMRFTRQICLLSQRMVRLKNCTLVLDWESSPLRVRGNALLLMQSIHVALVAMLEGCAAGDELRVAVSPVEGGALLRVSARASRVTPNPGELAALMSELGGECHVDQGSVQLRYQAAPAQEEENVRETGREQA